MIALGIIACLAGGVAGGIGYRCRGGFIGLGSGRTNGARLLWWALPNGVLFTALHYAATGQLSAGLFFAAAGASFIGLLGLPRLGDVPGGHGWCQGRGGRFYDGMCCIGIYRMALLAVAINHWMPGLAQWLPFCGVLHGLAYCIGWEFLDGRELIKWHPRNANADDGTGFDHFAIDGSEWGEALTGFLNWAAIVALAVPWGIL